jgi:DNA-directed RNA polymerase specialized sigma subunit
VAVKAVSKSISNLAFTRTDHAIVRNALLTLPEHQRNMIILKFWQNMEDDEIAGELKVTVKKVEEELHSGYKTLKERVLKETAFSRTKEQNDARAKEKERLEHEEFLRLKNETKTNNNAA